ncbi:MAG: hypothetical protein AAF431_19775 [Pseudomonadota bacterium]
MKAIFSTLALFAVTLPAQAYETFNGSVEIEQRLFWQSSPIDQLDKGQTSARLELEYFRDWNDGKDQLEIEPFLRWDAVDDERSHFDIRQLIWTHLETNWELAAGVGRVFWGVTETQHLVDIINQTDGVENIDGEDKLGQPMVRYSYFDDLGNIDVFVLPYFRTRTFNGPDSRLTGGLIVDNDNEVYQSGSGQDHVDLALRYSNTLGPVSLGLSWFSGTSREPDLLRFFDPTTLSTTPFYPQIDQLGADIQVTTDAWLIKLEAIQRNHSQNVLEDFAAITTGVEYTFVGIFGSIYDLGVLAEYSWDERGERATSLFQNDLFVGARLALNDMSDSEVLFGIANDLDDSDSRSIFLEAATRVDGSLTANIELRYFEADNPNDLLFRFKDDSFIQVGLEYFF